MRTTVGRRERVALVGLVILGVASIVGGPVTPAQARPTRGQRCTAGKALDVGRLVGASLACHAKARAKAVAVSTSCLDKASGRFQAGFDNAACPGDGVAVRSLVDACVATLAGDVAGTGRCAGAVLRALGAGAQSLGACAARDALHAGKGAACRTKVLGRLDGALAKAGACVATAARDDLVACWDAIGAALSGTSTTTSTTTTTAPEPTSSTTSTTSTSTPPTTGATLLTTTSTTTTETTTSEPTTTEIATTSTTTATETTTTTMCATAATCPGEDNECQARACIEGTCGFTYTPGETVVTDQIPGNCHDTICNGAGGFIEGIDPADVPDDGNQCTVDSCNGGTPVHTPAGEGTACDQNGGIVCDGLGSCVACLTVVDCPGADTECAQRTCNANQCGVTYTPTGTPVATQIAGDCHTNQCDGSGGVVNVIDDSDADDLNECTTDSCDQGIATHTPLPDTTPCTNGECNLGFCCAVGQVCG